MLYKRFREEWLKTSRRLFLQSLSQAVTLSSMDDVPPSMNMKLGRAFKQAADVLDVSYGHMRISAETRVEMRQKIRSALEAFASDESMDQYVDCVDKALMKVDLSRSVSNPSQREHTCVLAQN